MIEFEEVGVVALTENSRWRVSSLETPKGRWFYVFEEYQNQKGEWWTAKSKEKKNPYMFRVHQDSVTAVGDLLELLTGGAPF